ncbi:MAG: bis(5'-nucleosyl)-tetraphosphatase (symmetrical) YqeK [Cyanobacteria bacterium Co-bin13]|nr:bis(5'-nucleosyl)-tetraphosphatase (symmetrical) YqeK [Cyanobacteria bacterium Co-bin13]
MRETVLEWLAANVPSQRLQHVLRVEEMSVSLARHYGLCPLMAAQAGLMHDLAKFFKPQRLLEMALAEGLTLDLVDQTTPHLLHADVSAIVARDRFGVEEEGVLSAIANHTLGRPGMDALSCIVYLADTLEPGRGNTATLNALREMSFTNLTTAVYRTCDYTLTHLIEQQRPIHPRALATRNWFLQASRGALQPPAGGARAPGLEGQPIHLA